MEKNAIELSKYIIAGGNPTLLVKGSFVGEKQRIVRKYLESVDQIGFVKDSSLEMMGNELCINALLALASTLNQKGFLYTNALVNPVSYFNNNRLSAIRLPLNYKVSDKNILLLEGIGFKISSYRYKVSKSELKALAQKFNLPAFGIIFYKGNQINPYIYVKETDSLKAESACGSGSIALNILAGLEEIKQPIGQIITVSNTNNQFEISATVKKLEFTAK